MVSAERHDAPPPPTVLCVGMSNLDHVWRVRKFPPEHSRTPVEAYWRVGGGPAATAAVAVAKLGGRAALWSCHGDDDDGRWLTRELTALGVDVEGVRVAADGTTPLSAVLVAPGGERYIFPYRNLAQLDSDVGRDAATIRDTQCVLFDGRYPKLSARAIGLARDLGVPVVADLADDAAWHLARHADHLIVSQECAAQVTGRDDPSGALALLRCHENQVVGITLGAEGFIAEVEGRVVRVPAARIDEVADTTGAGDVFHGAYAYGVARGWTVARCAAFASMVAGMKCASVGGRSGIPTFGEVEANLSRQPELAALWFEPNAETRKEHTE